MIWLGVFLSLAMATSWPEAFDEAAYKNLVKKSQTERKGFVIYTWSPHMNLSQRGFDELPALKLPGDPKIVCVRDPDSDLKFARKIASEHKWPEECLRPVTSTTLLGRHIRVHYPTYVFAKSDGKISGAVPGYKNPPRLQQFAKRYLQ